MDLRGRNNFSSFSKRVKRIWKKPSKNFKAQIQRAAYRLIDELNWTPGAAGSMTQLGGGKTERLMFNIGYLLSAAITQNVPVEHFIQAVLRELEEAKV